MKRLLVLIFIVSHSFAFAHKNQDYRKLTFHKMLTEEKSEDLSECTKALKSFYSDGKSIQSTLLHDNIVTIENHNFPLDSNRGLVFFHYTNAKAVKKSAKKNTPMQIFKYLRRSGIHSQPELYIAADPNTSSAYGKIQMKVYLKDGVNLLDHSFSNSQYEDTVELIAKSIIKENTELEPCGKNGFGDSLKIYYLGLEDHNVAIVKYNSIHDNYWFQLFDPYSVSKIELGNH